MMKLLPLLALLFVLACKSNIDAPLPPVKEVPFDYGDASLWLSTAREVNGYRYQLQRQRVSLKFTAGAATGTVIAVDSAQTFQTMDGFGAALTGSSAYLLKQLPDNQRSTLLRELFLPDSSGIGLSYLRICIGASDFSAYGSYTYDDMPPGQKDPDLQQFSMAVREPDLLPVLKEILVLVPDLKIMATPWSPPAWMKSNDNLAGGSLKPEYYAVYAQYFVRYLQAMQAEGIRIDAISPQNEPLHSAAAYPCLSMSAEEQKVFVRDHLGPALQAAGLGTRIILYDHNCDRPDYPIQILDDPAAKAFADGSAFHLYGGDISAMSQVHAAHPDKNLYFTEQSGGKWAPDYGGNLRWYARNMMIGAPRNWSRNVLFWNLALDSHYGPTNKGCSDCRGVITIEGSQITRNEEYYALAQAAKFVPPGSLRISSQGGSNSLIHVAFLTPEGKKVLLVLNDAETEQVFSIQTGNKYISTRLPGGSWATYVW